MKIKYPKQWADASSEGLIINHSQLTNLCVANDLSSGEIAYVAEQMRMAAMRTINSICESKEQ